MLNENGSVVEELRRAGDVISVGLLDWLTESGFDPLVRNTVESVLRDSTLRQKN